ncbi:hypothetical protein EV426DRAFT_596956 [Tirmania nivea]|nr:hypothetical protein EV426DRAFT_596956 [Tirmania nivea]
MTIISCLYLPQHIRKLQSIPQSPESMKMLQMSSTILSLLGLLYFLGNGFVTAYPKAGENLSALHARQFPDIRRNLTFDNVLIPNEKYCNSKLLPNPYEGEYIIQSLVTDQYPTLPATVYNTTQTPRCREHADHQGPFWRAYSLPNVITAGGSLNISRAGPWREGGFGVLSIALGSEKDMEVSGADPTGAIIRVYMDGKSRTGGNIAAAEFDFPAPPVTWGNYGPWLITTTAGFDIGLREFQVRAEYRWTDQYGTQQVKPVTTLWVDHVQVRVVKLED